MIVSFAELGTAIPSNGGAYAYLSDIYGPVAACLFSWTMIILLKPASVAIVSLVFGEYVCRLVFLRIQPSETPPIWASKVAALFCIWSIVGINTLGTPGVTRINTVFTLVKIIALASIAIAGMTLICTHPYKFASTLIRSCR